MRRDLAHVAPRSTGVVGNNEKALSGSFSISYRIGLWCFCLCPCSSVEKGVSSVRLAKVSTEPRPEERPPTKRDVAGSSPARGSTLNSPVCSANYRRGLTSGLRQRLGLTTHSHFDACARRKQGRNDMPQLQSGDGEGRTRAEQHPAIQVPAVR
jgi:hypothetical protein